MPNRRESIEARIISYFRDEELSKATLVFGLVKGEMTKRQPKKRKVSKPKDVGPMLGLSNTSSAEQQALSRS